MNLNTTNKSFSNFRSDSFQFSVAVTDADAANAPVDLTTAVVTFTAKRSVADSDAVAVVKYVSSDASPKVTMPAPTTGIILVKIAAQATALLAPGSQTDLVYDVHVVLADGSRWTVQTGAWSVKPAVLGT